MERDQSNIQMIAILRDNFEMIKSVVSVENITAMELSIMEISRTIWGMASENLFIIKKCTMKVIG